MTEEMKLKLFEKELELERLASKETYDGRNYNAEASGAFQMLDILGIGREYIRWAEGKEI